MKENAKQVKLTINGRDINADESLTILEVARQNGIDIPTLCHHPALSNWGGCRLCVVEVDNSPKLVASCVMPVRNGMEVVTENEAITASRRLTLELLFAERNHNCMFCPQSGDCELQQMAYALQMDHLTISQNFEAYPTDTTGEYMVIDHNRCILCGRCVRACQEIAGSYVLGFHNRGPKTLIGFDLLEHRENSACINCGACLQVCPTGAISSRYRTHYAVKGQPSARKTIKAVCADCGLLCPTQTVVRDNQMLEVRGVLARPDGRPDSGQLCYKGRFEVLKTQGNRLMAPMLKDEQGVWREENWETALDLIARSFSDVKNGSGPDALFGLASSAQSNETLMLFQELMTLGWGTQRLDTLDGVHFRNLTTAWDDGTRGLPPEVSWKKIAAADMVLVVGADPQQSHPMLVSLLRRAYIERALPIAVIGRIECAALFSDLHLEVATEGLPSALAALAARVAAPGKRDEENPALSPQQREVLAAAARAFISAKSPLILAGSHLTEPVAAAALQDLFRIARSKEALIGQSAFISFLKPQSNSMAAWRMGLAARHADAGPVEAGMLLMENEGNQAMAILKSLKPAPRFLAVISPYFNTALAEMAQVMLPKPLWWEEDGTFTSMEGQERLYKPKAIDPPGHLLKTWEVLQGLSKRIDAPGAGKPWEDIRARAEQFLDSSAHVPVCP